MIRHLIGSAIAKYPEYFRDKSKVANAYSMAVAESHRSQGLASLINEATIQEALKLGCDYIISSVVSPETIHASAKGGYQILAEIPY